MLGADGVRRGPAADSRVSVVAQVDVAAAAVAVLRSPPTYRGRTYDLTGPAAITLHEAAQIMADRTGRAVRYEPETIEQAYASRASYGAPSVAARCLGVDLHRHRQWRAGHGVGRR